MGDAIAIPVMHEARIIGALISVMFNVDLFSYGIIIRDFKDFNESIVTWSGIGKSEFFIIRT